ncbi:MAG: hypothetical protein GY778_28325 [bacterium]|nr:hypothetical protein [bacterium]
MAKPRFVILHHRLPDGEHWDLMLERGDVLATWQLAADPTAPNALPAVATRIGDHRKRYLDYEGPVSRNRGTVTRVDAGSWQLVSEAEDQWQMELTGQLLAGRFFLVHDRGGATASWKLIQA